MNALTVPEDAPREMHAAILMATYNGARFLGEQIDSIDKQAPARIDMIVSDDGSTDATRAILDAHAVAWRRGHFIIRNGPQRGFAENFRALLVDNAVDADLVAFCDQDDIWLPDKLAMAARWISGRDGAEPALFCGRTAILKPDGTVNGRSPLFAKAPSFRNAIVQSLAGGNTMVMNRPAHRLIVEAARRTAFVSHDWFAYMIVAGAGGAVRYQPEPLVLYRQHEANQVGPNTGARARADRLRRLMAGQFRRWMDINLDGLERCRDLLSPEARACLDDVAAARRGPPWRRLQALRRAGVYRQTPQGQIGLVAACLLDRL